MTTSGSGSGNNDHNSRPIWLNEILAQIRDDTAIELRDGLRVDEPVCQHFLKATIGHKRGTNYSNLVHNTFPISVNPEPNSGPTITSFMAFVQESDKPVAWAIEGLFPKEGITILSGAPGVGKSWLLADLAIDLATGASWLGEFSTRPSRVLYLELESPQANTRSRLQKLIGAKELETNALPAHIVRNVELRLNRPSGKEVLRGLIERVEPNVIIIDSFIRVHEADENSATEMAKVSRALLELSHRYSVLFILSDHERKPGPHPSAPQNMLRGSTEKAAMVDSLLSIRPKGNEIVIHHSKSRHAVRVDSFRVQIQDTPQGNVKLEFRGYDSPKSSSGNSDHIRELILRLTEDWTVRQHIIAKGKEAGIPTRKLRECLNQLFEKGELERRERKGEGRGKPAHEYRKTGDSCETTSNPDQQPLDTSAT